MPSLDQRFAQKVAANQDKQGDEQAAGMFLLAFLYQVNALQQPGQSQAASGYKAPEGLSLLARVRADQRASGSPRATQEGQQAQHLQQDRAPFHTFQLMQGAGWRAEDAQNEANQGRTSRDCRGEEDTTQELAARPERDTGCS